MTSNQLFDVTETYFNRLVGLKNLCIATKIMLLGQLETLDFTYTHQIVIRPMQDLKIVSARKKYVAFLK